MIISGAAIASLLAYLTIEEWLVNFAYQEEIRVGAFVFATAIALALAYITMALQSYKTAHTNPVNFLRNE